MPYIVTVNRELWPGGNVATEPLSRRAVATLDQAVFEAWRHHKNHERLGDVRALITESGGTITLPDGKRIKVERQPDNFDVAAYKENQ